MSEKLWSKAIVAWMNCLNTSCHIHNFDQIQKSHIEDLIKSLNPDQPGNISEFIAGRFPNYKNNDFSLNTKSNDDSLDVCTLILIYVCFSSDEQLGVIRQNMCVKLENSVQECIAGFLISIQSYEDVFAIDSNILHNEIAKCSQEIEDNVTTSTPLRSTEAPMKCESPLLGFFQTPVKSSLNRLPSSCDLDYPMMKIKQLTEQLSEEEFEKFSLQEELNRHKNKCIDYEFKLKNKMEEMKRLEEEWEKESNINEKLITKLSFTVKKSFEERKILYKSLLCIENYAKTLENELTHLGSEEFKSENRYNILLRRIEENHSEICKIRQQVVDMGRALANIEPELQALKEKFSSFAEYQNMPVSNYSDDQSYTASLSSQKRNFLSLKDEKAEFQRKHGKGKNDRRWAKLVSPFFCLKRK